MSKLERTHIERQGVAVVLGAVHAAGWIFREQKEVDHGIDAHMESTVEHRITGRLIALQIKTGSCFFEEETDVGFVYRGEQRHLDYWLEHSLPVLLLLVDLTQSLIYWVQVTESLVISTGRGWKIIVPRKNLLNSSALGELGKIAANLKISRPYSVLESRDVSHGAVKRYSAQILLYSDFPKDYVKSLASEITQQIAIERWSGSPQLESRFAERDAEVVWLFMCRTLDDAKQGNWLCRTQWISPALDRQSRPKAISAEVSQGEIGIVWSDTRGEMERFALAHELSKGEAVAAITQTIEQVAKHFQDNRPHIESFVENPNPSHLSILRLRKEAESARDLYFRGGDIGMPPLELADLMTALDSVLASYDNAFMLFGEEFDDDSAANRAAVLAETYLRAFDQDLALFSEEARRRHIYVRLQD